MVTSTRAGAAGEYRRVKPEFPSFPRPLKMRNLRNIKKKPISRGYENILLALFFLFRTIGFAGLRACGILIDNAAIAW